MIKLVYCMHRRPGMTMAEFQKHWREVHAPLVKKNAAVLGIRRYVQLHTLDSPFVRELNRQRGCELEPFDGVAEIWLDSLDGFASVLQSEEGRRAVEELAEDERRFIDFERSIVIFAEEHPIIA
ncbi:MAG TPA: EthD domain-containing protein [Dehalococcoidia bacterium]|nr:EthD domain-containing protein [Dehalococcoidia bacterium]